MVSLYEVSLEEELQRYPKLRVQDIEEIKEWMKSQPHLPLVTDEQLAHFLYANCYDIHLTKKSIEHNFTYKSSVAQLFDDWDPRTNGTVDYIRNVIIAINNIAALLLEKAGALRSYKVVRTFALLPKVAPSDSRVMLFRFHNPLAEAYDFSAGAKWSLMSLQSLLFREGQQQEFKVVFDTANYSFAHVLRNPLHLLKAYNDYGMNAIEIKVVQVHFINSSSVVKRLITIIKPFLGKKCIDMLNFHTSPDGFFRTMPLEVVPSDYGGLGNSLKVLQEENISRVEEAREALVAYSELRTNERKRMKKTKSTKTTGKQYLQELD